MNSPNFPNMFQNNAGAHSFKGAPSFGAHLQKTGLYENEADVTENFESLVEETRDWLHSKGFKQVEVLMDLMLDKNEGETRDDNITPSALHELTQVIWFISCIEADLHVDDVEGVLSVIFAHDLGEDFNIRPDALEQHLVDEGIPRSAKTEQLKEDFDAISKRYGKGNPNKHATEFLYSMAVQNNKNASIAKMIDRIHNIMTLINVKDRIEMMEYIAKTEQLQKDYVRDDVIKFPSQAEMYTALRKATKETVQACHYYMVDTGKPITDNDDLVLRMPEKGFRDMPLGLHPVIVAAERVRALHLETNLNPAPTISDDKNPQVT